MHNGGLKKVKTFWLNVSGIKDYNCSKNPKMKGCVIDFINFPTFSKSKTNKLSNTIPNSDLI